MALRRGREVAVLKPGVGRGSLPVPADLPRLAARLAVEERELLASLAALEERARRFADVEQPAYATWRRLTFGRELATLQELAETVRARSVLAARIAELVERDGFSPREALFLVVHPEEWPAHATGGGFDPDEVEARRRAKRERKRAERRERRRAERAAARSSAADERVAVATPTARAARGARVVDLYRRLARRLHPDSPHALTSLAPERRGALWHDVQDAYTSGSGERLVAISAWIDSLATDQDDAGSGPASRRAATRSAAGAPLLSLAERHERLRALRRAHRARERALAELEDDPAWDFERRRREAAPDLERRTRATIDDEIDRLERALHAVEEQIAAIGAPRRPRAARRGRASR